ncbi:MAG: ABC transporter permease subunit [Rectinemataceae bacterium]
MPRDPVEASIIDGASRWQTFVHVTFPILRPVTTVVITMAMVNMGYGAAISVLLSVLVILVSVFYIKNMWKKDLLYY